MSCVGIIYFPKLKQTNVSLLGRFQVKYKSIYTYFLQFHDFPITFKCLHAY